MSSYSLQDMKTDQHKAAIAESLEEAYTSLDHAKALIQQQNLDNEMMQYIKAVEWKVDRIGAALTLIYGDVHELNTMVEELQQQRDEIVAMIRLMLGKLLR